MTLFDRIEQARALIQQRSSCKPQIGVVLGSGLGAFADKVSNTKTIDYADIPHFPVSAVQGHAGKMLLGDVHGVPCAVLSGRVHYYEGYPMEVLGYPVRVLKALGITHLLLTNAAGSVNPSYVPGDFMVIVDHINLMGDNPLRGENDDRLGPRFPDMTQAYCKEGQEALHLAGQDVGLGLHQGVYAGLGGPSYETPAEIRMLHCVGADAVGLSTIPEVIVGAHAGLKVAGLSVITNRAAGLGSAPLSHEEVQEVGQRIGNVLCDLLASAVKRMA